MDTLPQLSETQIQSRASSSSWSRGEAYFRNGNVLRVVWREGALSAEVEGSDVLPYQVRVLFDPQGNLLHARCSCPYSGYGDCKHIVAVLLYLIRRPKEVERRPSLRSLLSSLNREQLLELMLRLEGEYSNLVEAVESILPSLTGAPSASESLVDLLAIQARVRQDVRRIGLDAYRGYSEGWDEWPLLTEALAPALQQANAFLKNRDSRTALLILETATQAWLEGCCHLNRGFLSDILEFEEDGFLSLDRAWTEALLRADLSLEERHAWEEKLRTFQKRIPVKNALEMSIAAARQGWEYPPLVAAMQGKITEKGAWGDGEIPAFADSLAEIRLDILREQERFQEYLNLAKAEGFYEEYVKMLLELGHSEEALNEAKALLQSPDEILSLARAFKERGEIDKGIQLAAYGLALGEPSKRHHLALWLRDEAASLGQRDLALQAAWEAFKVSPSFREYRWLKEYLGGEWPSYAPRAMGIVKDMEQSYWASEAVEIYLYEKMYDQAMALTEQRRLAGKLRQVIDAVREEHPRWAFAQCLYQAEEIMDAGRADEYENAVEWLRLGRSILLKAGLQSEWYAVINRLLERHQRKYKLRPMLEKLR